MKNLTSPEIESLLPTICEAWREEQYPHTLAPVLVELVKVRKRPPELAFAVVAGYADEWLTAHLLAEHSATASTADRRKAVGALMKEVLETVGKVEREGE